MPEDTDESELGNAPTAVTAMSSTGRNREPTQQLAIPDPAWADSSLPGTSSEPVPLGGTLPHAEQPTPTPRQRARVLLRGMVHEFKKLPHRVRLAIIISTSLLTGLLLGLLVAPRGGAAPRADSDPGLVEHARRLTLDERDMVVRALSVSDTTAALMMLRSMGVKDRLAADPLAQALRGRLALTVRDGVDALDNFEAALASNPKLASEPWLPAAVVQTFMTNKAARTNALLARLDKADAVRALEAACLDWQGRVRRAAQESLKGFSAACPDPVGTLMLDAYQADKCDAARAVVQKLVPLERTDERVGAALDAISRRPPVANCVADLIPRK